MSDAFKDRIVTALEQMAGAMEHARQMVPSLAGLGPIMGSIRSHVQEARNLITPPEPPALAAPSDEPQPASPEPDHSGEPSPAPEPPAPTEPLVGPDMPPPAGPQPDHTEQPNP